MSFRKLAGGFVLLVVGLFVYGYFASPCSLPSIIVHEGLLRERGPSQLQPIYIFRISDPWQVKGVVDYASGWHNIQSCRVSVVPELQLTLARRIDWDSAGSRLLLEELGELPVIVKVVAA